MTGTPAAIDSRGTALLVMDCQNGILGSPDGAERLLAPDSGDIVVRKSRVGAFPNTDLDQRLREADVNTLIRAGVATSGVVLSTVRAAADRDYRLVVLSDACADRDQQVHDFLTRRVFPKQADVITTDELEPLLD